MHIYLPTQLLIIYNAHPVYMYTQSCVEVYVDITLTHSNKSHSHAYIMYIIHISTVCIHRARVVYSYTKEEEED